MAARRESGREITVSHVAWQGAISGHSSLVVADMWHITSQRCQRCLLLRAEGPKFSSNLHPLESMCLLVLLLYAYVAEPSGPVSPLPVFLVCAPHLCLPLCPTLHLLAGGVTSNKQNENTAKPLAARKGGKKALPSSSSNGSAPAAVAGRKRGRAQLSAEGFEGSDSDGTGGR